VDSFYSIVLLHCLQVHLECAGLLQTLFVVTGSCQGLEIGLDVESVSFGAVVQTSSSTRQFIMNNTGDIGARFVSLPSFFCTAPWATTVSNLIPWILCLSVRTVYGISDFQCFDAVGWAAGRASGL